MKFIMEIEIDNDNVWMRNAFSLGVAIENVGKKVASKELNFDDMYFKKPIKDVYGNEVGWYRVKP